LAGKKKGGGGTRMNFASILWSPGRHFGIGFSSSRFHGQEYGHLPDKNYGEICNFEAQVIFNFFDVQVANTRIVFSLG